MDDYSNILIVKFDLTLISARQKENVHGKGSIPKRKCPKLWKKSIIFLTPPLG